MFEKNCSYYLNYLNCLNKFLYLVNIKYIFLLGGYFLVVCLKSDLEI